MTHVHAPASPSEADPLLGPTPGSPARPRRARGRRTATARLATLLLLVPAAAALSLLFFYPLARIVQSSLTEQAGLGNYVALFTDGYSVAILLRTLAVGLVVAALCLCLAFPYAYAMTVCRPVTRAILFTIVLIPFWTNATAKNFVWLALFQRGGAVDETLSAIGIHYPLIGTLPGVVIAMVQVLLPFAVLPLFARLGQIDRRLIDAARGLGATRVRSFLRVYLPLSAPGLAASGTLVFILALGFYVTPAMIGSPQETLIAQLIMARVQVILDFGGAGAVGVFLLVVTLLALGASGLVSRRLSGGSRSATAGTTP